MVKKIIIGFISFIMVAMVGVSIYFSMIDWNEHKDKLSTQFNEITGKVVVFEGPVAFTLLPSPYLTASNVKIFNSEGANTHEPLATIKELVVSLSLLPLIHGDFEVTRMSMVEPDIFMEMLADGQLNWYSPLSVEQQEKLESIDVKLESLTLEKAKLNFTDVKHGVETHLSNLNAEVIAD